MLLVMLSLFLMYLDIYTSKENTSYLTSACIFFAMLLYDHEKIQKTSKNKVQKNVSKLTSYAYIAILGVHLMLLIGSFGGKAVVLMSSSESVLGLKIQILDKMQVLSDWPLVVIAFIVFMLTFVEIFSESKDKSIGGNTTTNDDLTPDKGEPIKKQGNLTEEPVTIAH
ncbi:MAG TPA: hypothetical protein DG757_26395, partial [Bacillus sp. (in: Bacteria)]|nr:hypothetical protein [Bacillus sp. (in: firmicutes)]